MTATASGKRKRDEVGTSVSPMVVNRSIDDGEDRQMCPPSETKQSILLPCCGKGDDNWTPNLSCTEIQSEKKIDCATEVNVVSPIGVKTGTGPNHSKSGLLVKVLPVKVAGETTASPCDIPTEYQAVNILEWVGSMLPSSEDEKWSDGFGYDAPETVDAPLRRLGEMDADTEIDYASIMEWEQVIKLRDPIGWSDFGSEFEQLVPVVHALGENNPEVSRTIRNCRDRLERTMDCILGGTVETMVDSRMRNLLTHLYRDIALTLKQSCPREVSGSRKKKAVPLVELSDFNCFMNDWLLTNWINPYPDENEFEELAARCVGKTVDSIATWLINARTRKWRPALKQALSLNKSAEHLLEDSLRVAREYYMA